MEMQDVHSKIASRFIQNNYPIFFNKVNDKVFITSIGIEVIISKQYVKVIVDDEKNIKIKTSCSLYKYAVSIYYLYTILPIKFFIRKLINKILKLFENE